MCTTKSCAELLVAAVAGVGLTSEGFEAVLEGDDETAGAAAAFTGEADEEGAAGGGDETVLVAWASPFVSPSDPMAPYFNRAS